LEGNYNEKCDIWSCGVILYILLCGYPPFNGHTDSEILKKVRQGVFEFENQDWSCISTEARALIRNMLQRDINKRYSAL
jgi:calcium-dependent protein kinase